MERFEQVPGHLKKVRELLKATKTGVARVQDGSPIATVQNKMLDAGLKVPEGTEVHGHLQFHNDPDENPVHSAFVFHHPSGQGYAVGVHNPETRSVSLHHMSEDEAKQLTELGRKDAEVRYANKKMRVPPVYRKPSFFGSNDTDE